MNKSSILLDASTQLPQSFFDVIIEDISPLAWSRLLQHNPSLRTQVLEGFSGRPSRLPKLIHQRQTMARLRRILQGDPSLLEEVLQTWGQEKLSLMAFLEMLHHEFIRENLLHLKNLLKPERLLAGLHLLDCLHEELHPHITQDHFWKRELDLEVLEPLVPVFELWREITGEVPQLSTWMEELTGLRLSHKETQKQPPPAPGGREAKNHREDETRKRLERKLAGAHEEMRALREQGQRYRLEAEEARSSLTELQGSFQKELKEALRKQHEAWYQRFQKADLPVLGETAGRLEKVLTRAHRALELQKEADDKYGLVSDVRRKLLELDGLLEEMEKIHDQSMFVHQEVTRVKGELEREKKRLLETPGMEKVLRDLPSSITAQSLEQHIRLLDASLQSLPRLSRLTEVVHRLENEGFLENAEALKETIQAKKYQIFAPLYGRFQPPRGEPATQKFLPEFEDFVHSGRGKNHDLYVDGYNILLNAQGIEQSSSSPLAELREEFIERVCEKSRFFKKVHLVFDGIEHYRDQIKNTEIIYTDRVRGVDADNFIIQAIRRRKDRNALLVTADQEIIEATEHKVYAFMDPCHFYLFVFEVSFPFFP